MFRHLFCFQFFCYFCNNCNKCSIMANDNVDNTFGTLRLKRSTLQELKRLKISVEMGEGKELTNDDFIKILIDIATKEK